jgi:maltose O-acetyltransferase
MIIGDRVRIASDIATTQLAAVYGATLDIGAGTFINHGCSIAAMESVRIGPRCSIGSHVIMMDNDFHSIDPAQRDLMPPSRPIVLEANVWLGVRVIVLRGVRIGEGSVICAGSVVTRDIPPRTLAGGNPARPIRSI